MIEHHVARDAYCYKLRPDGELGTDTQLLLVTIQYTMDVTNNTTVCLCIYTTYPNLMPSFVTEQVFQLSYNRL
jgi:hypothetical protein